MNARLFSLLVDVFLLVKCHTSSGKGDKTSTNTFIAPREAFLPRAGKFARKLCNLQKNAAVGDWPKSFCGGLLDEDWQH